MKPPKVNKNKKPKAKRLGVITVIDPVHKVPNQLNILIPVRIFVPKYDCIIWQMHCISRTT